LTPRRKASLALTTALTVVLASLLAATLTSRAAIPEEGLEAKWSEGSLDCAGKPGPAIEVHRYDPRTFILRESLCTTFEAPLMYLLVGEQKALLIDTGDVAEPGKVALARTVQELLPGEGSQKLPLLVVHTHRHLDHRAGDGQLRALPGTQVIGYDLESIKQFYNLPDWPRGRARIDLGQRAIDVIPTPGHNETEVTFYDRVSGLVFSGDFLLPGRILVDDIGAYRESAARLINALGDRPVTAFLGGHIEMDAHGKLFEWQSQHHPDERALPMTSADLQGLATALARFNGFYTESGGFTLINSIHILIAIAVAIGAVLIALVWIVVRYARRRRARKAAQAA
jgi:glyoxylase-like metal-dependent hydrolase (beta-lactamase superfamily II)